MSRFLWFWLQSLQKVLIWAHFVFHQSNIGSKKAKFDADFASVEKLPKMWKKIEKVMKNGVFFITICKSVTYIIFLDEWFFFSIISNDSQSASNEFCDYWIYAAKFFFSYLDFLLTLKPKIARNGSRKRSMYFVKVS